MSQNTVVSAHAVLVLAAAAFLAAAAGPAAAQQAGASNVPSGKIAFVNPARVMAESKLTSAAKKALDAKHQKLAKQIEAGPKEQIERRMAALDQDLNLEREDALRQYVDKTNSVIRRIALADNLDVVFVDAAYFGKNIDITDKVIRELDAGR